MRMLAVVLGCLLLGGCAALPVRPVQGTAIRSRVFQRNYSLGALRVAVVGEPVATVKDFVEVHRRGRQVMPSVSFRVKQALSPWYNIGADTPLPIVGTLAVEGREYSLAMVNDDAGYKTAVLVGADGKPYRRLVAQATVHPIFMVGNAHFEPADVSFQAAADDVVVDSTNGFVNYELIYGGTDGRAFTLTYREYTPQDLIKPGFSQTLTYENSARSVRFRGLELEVTSVSSSQLEYKVVADGLKGP